MRVRTNLFARPRKNRQRSESGMQLVELLVSVVVSGMIVTAISGSLMQMTSFASNGQNQLLAADIAQEVIDNSRNMSFARLRTLCDQPQPITLLVNRKTAADSTDPYGAFQRPLGQDWVNLQYHQDGQDSEQSISWGSKRWRLGSREISPADSQRRYNSSYSSKRSLE